MRLCFLALSLLLVAGCAADVGPDGRAVGGPCRDEFDCAAGSFCRTGPDLPGGTCTTNCRDDDDCAGGSACVEALSGMCLLTCEADEDCEREGYVCREQTRRGASGTTKVCTGG